MKMIFILLSILMLTGCIVVLPVHEDEPTKVCIDEAEHYVDCKSGKIIADDAYTR